MAQNSDSGSRPTSHMKCQNQSMGSFVKNSHQAAKQLMKH